MEAKAEFQTGMSQEATHAAKKACNTQKAFK
jgi:hypothetical protein